MNIDRFLKKSRPVQIQIALSVVFQLAILILVIELIGRRYWFATFAGTITLLLTFTPAIVERQLSLHLPVEFSLITTLFLYASFALGEVGDYYAKYWWWDLMLHSISALTIGIIGFLMLYVFYMTKRIQIAPIYVALGSFCLAVTTGTIWEIFEFTMDVLFSLNMQKSGLPDTMSDLVVNAAGSFVAATLGYFYVKNGDSLIVDRLVTSLVEKNPALFNRREK